MKQILCVYLVLLLSFHPSPLGAKAAPKTEILQTPGELIALINAYRAENGLPAYQQNSILMLTAQAQADYQASTESVTHEGPGGTRPRDRAFNAGYGGGEHIFISEIIYGGTSAGPEAAVNWWKTSQIHNDTMLASTYQEIGAGVASANGRNYYTAVTGYVAGGTYTPSTPSPDSDTVSEPEVVVVPVIVATPQSDGSVLHIIRTGQTLWTLAAVYNVLLEDLLELNDLPENAVIYPGDEILVRGALAPTATMTTDLPTATQTPTEQVALENVDTSASNGKDMTSDESDADAISQNAKNRLVILVALAAILGVILVSFFLQEKSIERSEEQDPLKPLD